MSLVLACGWTLEGKGGIWSSILVSSYFWKDEEITTSQPNPHKAIFYWGLKKTMTLNKLRI
jgi:hypothetical protein